MGPDERDLLTASVAAAIDPTVSPADNDAALEALGWHDMLSAEPVDAVAVVFGRLGAAAAAATVIDDVVGSALGLAAGAAVVHPRWGTADLADPAATPIVGVAGDRIRSAPEAHVVCRGGVAAVDTAAVEITAPAADRRIARVTATGPLGPITSGDDAAVSAAIVAGRRAVAHQLQAIAGGMLTLARDHAVDRIQFGRPIGSFQAVRHKLAETHVAVEAAGEALAAADENPTPLTVDLARVLAGRAAIDASRNCQQVLAGIGFTRDHDFHRYLFAAIELDGLYGTTALLTKALGRRLIAERTVPRTVDL